MYPKRMIRRVAILLLWAVAMVGSLGCAVHKAANEAKSAAAEDGRVYDERFPVKVWTNEDGLMIMEDSLGSYYPSEEQFLACVVGKCWKPTLCYDYYELGSQPVNWAGKLFETDKGITGWVPGVSFPIYFGENGKATLYKDIIDLRLLKEDKIREKENYRYDSSTGTLYLFIFDQYKFVKATPDELWFVQRDPGPGEKTFQVVRYTPLTPEDVRVLDETYREYVYRPWYEEEEENGEE